MNFTGVRFLEEKHSSGGDLLDVKILLGYVKMWNMYEFFVIFNGENLSNT